jgi:hypothetical protein
MGESALTGDPTPSPVPAAVVKAVLPGEKGEEANGEGEEGASSPDVGEAADAPPRNSAFGATMSTRSDARAAAPTPYIPASPPTPPSAPGLVSKIGCSAESPALAAGGGAAVGGNHELPPSSLSSLL